MSIWDNIKKFAQPYSDEDYDDYDGEPDDYDEQPQEESLLPAAALPLLPHILLKARFRMLPIAAPASAVRY